MNPMNIRGSSLILLMIPFADVAGILRIGVVRRRDAPHGAPVAPANPLC
jgi:hypothetical protein